MEFEAFPKVPRLNRGVVITEKIDGTNAQVLVYDFSFFKAAHPEVTEESWEAEKTKGGVIQAGDWLIRAGSRNRWLASGSDNFGFWAWVYANREGLAKLGPGRHFGEWWGQGIQRTYEMDHKRFSLFNTSRWLPVQQGAVAEAASRVEANFQNPFNLVPELDTVPIVYHGNLLNEAGGFAPDAAIQYLKATGSLAKPGFNDPEGIMVYLVAARQMYKVTVKDDDKPKSAVVEASAPAQAA